MSTMSRSSDKIKPSELRLSESGIEHTVLVRFPYEYKDALGRLIDIQHELLKFQAQALHVRGRQYEPISAESATSLYFECENAAGAEKLLKSLQDFYEMA